MQQQVPGSLHALITEYLVLLETKVPHLVTGLYLHGSIARGAFDERQSDIDFVAFLSHRALPMELDALREIHRKITTIYPQWLLEGSYLQWHELGQMEGELSPTPSHHDGHFDDSANFDINSVTWWNIKHHGIALIGPMPSELPLEVDWTLLMRSMHENLNSYWASFTIHPNRIAWLVSDFGVEWTVLGVLRQYYTFVAHDITSKVGAGEYALQHLTTEWHHIIQEALRIRRKEPESLYNSKLLRAVDNYKFLRYVINACNNLPQWQLTDSATGKS